MLPKWLLGCKHLEPAAAWQERCYCGIFSSAASVADSFWSVGWFWHYTHREWGSNFGGGVSILTRVIVNIRLVYSIFVWMLFSLVLRPSPPPPPPLFNFKYHIRRVSHHHTLWNVSFKCRCERSFSYLSVVYDLRIREMCARI